MTCTRDLAPAGTVSLSKLGLRLQLQACGSRGYNVIAWRLHNAGELCPPLPAALGLTSKGTENKQDLSFPEVRGVRFPFRKCILAKGTTQPRQIVLVLLGQKDKLPCNRRRIGSLQMKVPARFFSLPGKASRYDLFTFVKRAH